jgi:hypothetical protein
MEKKIRPSVGVKAKYWTAIDQEQRDTNPTITKTFDATNIISNEIHFGLPVGSKPVKVIYS